MSGIGKYRLVALDSNIFIYHFEDNQEFKLPVDLIYQGLIKTTIRAVTSVVSVIEALSYPMPDVVVKEIEEAFKNTPNLQILDVNYEIAREAAKIRRKYRTLRLPDAVQVASARFARAQIFITNDKRIKIFKELPIKLLTEI